MAGGYPCQCCGTVPCGIADDDFNRVDETPVNPLQWQAIFGDWRIEGNKLVTDDDSALVVFETPSPVGANGQYVKIDWSRASALDEIGIAFNYEDSDQSYYYVKVKGANSAGAVTVTLGHSVDGDITQRSYSANPRVIAAVFGRSDTMDVFAARLGGWSNHIIGSIGSAGQETWIRLAAPVDVSGKQVGLLTGAIQPNMAFDNFVFDLGRSDCVFAIEPCLAWKEIDPKTTGAELPDHWEVVSGTWDWFDPSGGVVEHFPRTVSANAVLLSKTVQPAHGGSIFLAIDANQPNSITRVIFNYVDAGTYDAVEFEDFGTFDDGIVRFIRNGAVVHSFPDGHAHTIGLGPVGQFSVTWGVDGVVVNGAFAAQLGVMPFFNLRWGVGTGSAAPGGTGVIFDVLTAGDFREYAGGECALLGTCPSFRESLDLPHTLTVDVPSDSFELSSGSACDGADCTQYTGVKTLLYLVDCSWADPEFVELLCNDEPMEPAPIFQRWIANYDGTYVNVMQDFGTGVDFNWFRLEVSEPLNFGAGYTLPLFETYGHGICKPKPTATVHVSA